MYLDGGPHASEEYIFCVICRDGGPLGSDEESCVIWREGGPLRIGGGVPLCHWLPFELAVIDLCGAGKPLVSRGGSEDAGDPLRP